MHHKFNLKKPEFSVESIDVLNVIRDRGYTYSYRTGRTKHGFLYVVSGVIDYSFIQSQELPLQATSGELVFIPKGSTYVGTYLEDGTQLQIIQFDLTSGKLPDYLDRPKKLRLPDAERLIGSFFGPVHTHGFGHPFYYLSCFYTLLWQLDEACTKIPAKYIQLLSALSELSAHFEKDLPVAYYAGLCQMSESNFRRLFREYTGQSPIEYRNALRLNSARIRLQSGEYNVSEAANTVGFSNLSFFIRLYKKKYGYTPKKE